MIFEAPNGPRDIYLLVFSSALFVSSMWGKHYAAALDIDRIFMNIYSTHIVCIEMTISWGHAVWAIGHLYIFILQWADFLGRTESNSFSYMLIFASFIIDPSTKCLVRLWRARLHPLPGWCRSSQNCTLCGVLPQIEAVLRGTHI